MMLLAVVVAALLAVATEATGQPAPTRVLTSDGSVLHGTITGGTLTVRTTFGADVRLDPRRLVSLAGNAFTLDDGSMVNGSLTTGQVQLSSIFGTLLIPAERLTEIQSTRATAARVTPPRPAAAVQFVNETRRNVSVCVNEETPCLQLGPSASVARTLGPGPMRLRVESTTTLGFVVLATGSFERILQVDGDTTVRVTEGDFR